MNGLPADMGHTRQRCVLAALLVDANRTVPVDQLVDRVWGERASGGTKGTLYGYLSRLRGALAAAGGVRIVRRSGGYVLETDPETVDLHQFRALVVRARADGDERAAVLLKQALGLWRGEAFATVDSPWFRDLGQTLERERFSAELDSNDIALRCGRQAGLLPGLVARTEEHPLDERLAGQLMLTLYREGRSADALSHYGRTRRILAGQLGIDPGAPLLRLHQQILTGDPALAVPGRGATAGPRPIPPAGPPTGPSVLVPRQLPASPRWFTGRDQQLAELTKTLDLPGELGGGMTISAIGGSGGIGKTWLAVHWAYENLDRFPDGQLYVDLRGFDPSNEPVAPAVAVRGFLDALGVEPGAMPVDPQAQTGLYRSLVANRRMLIVLDNAADADQAATLLPGSATCAVLVTSRRRLTGLATAHGAGIMTLDGLTGPKARELLGLHVGEERAAAEPEAVTALLDHCAGLPLAISVVGARAAAHPRFPLAVLAEELADQSARLDALDAGDLAANVRAVFTVSYRALAAESAEVFRLLGLAPGPEIGLAAAGSLIARPAGATRAVLRELETVHLVRQPVPGRYQLHDLVRLFAAERAGEDQPEESRRQALRRVTDFYLHTAYSGDRVLGPFSHHSLELGRPADGSAALTLPDQSAVMAWFRTEHVCLLAAQRLAVDQEWDVPAWQLARVLDGFMWRQGRLHDHMALWRTGLAAAERLHDVSVRAWAHRRLAHACARAGEHDNALEHARLALRSAEEAGDAGEQARVHDVVAWAWARQGDDRQALSHVRHALRLHRMGDDPLMVANAVNGVGWYEARLGDYEQALAHCEEGLAIHRRRGFRDGEACTLDSLGYIAHAAGRHVEALVHYGHARELFHDLGNTYEEANTLANLGDVHLGLGRHDEARESWERATGLYRAQHREKDVERLRTKLEARTTTEVTGRPGDG
ncbi:BTAD domain-containing putative transcriptional regulator [Streptomyces sp. 150FB]|uniref:AfsR/SARP family transcriptional regulator n=1 Tax=Streptomyces sp. 150FB TaxID=1576605 RepID=UPI001F2BF8BD|nr:BTAD domain-containing putative transcriptional regulator [Streptomyces sp. 150FB]